MTYVDRSAIGLKPELINNFGSLSKKYGTNEISITGHSLGAAEATLFVYDLLNDYPNYNINYFYYCIYFFIIWF